MSTPTDLLKVGNGHGHGHGMIHVIDEVGGVPGAAFVAAAGGVALASLALKLLGRDRTALFVGQWAPTLLLAGLFWRLREKD